LLKGNKASSIGIVFISYDLRTSY